MRSSRRYRRLRRALRCARRPERASRARRERALSALALEPDVLEGNRHSIMRLARAMLIPPRESFAAGAQLFVSDQPSGAGLIAGPDGLPARRNEHSAQITRHQCSREMPGIPALFESLFR